MPVEHIKKSKLKVVLGRTFLQNRKGQFALGKRALFVSSLLVPTLQLRFVVSSKVYQF